MHCRTVARPVRAAEFWLEVRDDMRRIFFCLAAALVAMLVFGAPSARAEDANRLTQFKVQVWPEYDKPTVLVLLEGTLADKNNLPRDVSVVIPSSATGIIATYENADGTLAAEQPYTSDKLDGGLSRLTFSTKTAQYHVEYYDDLLKGAPDKTMDFALQAPAPADQVTLEIQQPLKATNFSVNPPAQSTRNDGNFNISVLQFSNITAGYKIAAQVKYTKSDPNPSYVPTPVPATAAAPVTAPSGTSSIFLVAGIALVGLAAVFGFLVLQQRRRQAAPAPAMSRHARRRARASDRVFCTQCGQEMGPDDQFCPKCGTKRRVG